MLWLLLAAVLEAGGDALVRSGRHATAIGVRMALFAVGGLALFAYGYVVNAPSWDFGRSLGVYVVLFFVAAQLISWLAFHQAPSRAVLLGGTFILAGGVIMTLWTG